MSAVKEDASRIITAKATTMVILCIVSIIMGITPIYFSRHLKWIKGNKNNLKSQTIVKMLLAFGGGVLFCTTFLHMLPEVVEGVGYLSEKGDLQHNHLPLAEVFVCVGFFFIYLVEELVHTRLRYTETQTKESQENQNDEFEENESNSNSVNIKDNEAVEGDALGHIHRGHSHGFGHGHTHLPSPATAPKNNREFIISSLKGLLIVLGLSVHELFEGLAIGLEGSSNGVWYMFAAVAAHKFVIAFCIGVELVASKTHHCLSITYVCIFAIVSPMGIGIGMLLVGGDNPAVNGVLPVVLQGIATGTLLYVVFFEILHHNRDGLLQYLAIIVGFLVMCGLQFAVPHHHSHGHGHNHGHGHDYHEHY